MRQSSTIKVPELPWPLTFLFAHTEDGLKCFGLEIGAPILRGDERCTCRPDPDDCELTPDRLHTVRANFVAYRDQAAALLVPTPDNVQTAVHIREGMGRRTRKKLTPAYLARLVADWRARRDEPSAMTNMADDRHVDRHTLRRQLEKAVEDGLMPEGIWPQRNT